MDSNTRKSETVMTTEKKVQETKQEIRGRSLRESKWSIPDFDPVKARKASGLFGTFQEEHKASWLFSDKKTFVL
ncbi:hypothetical protein V8E54_007458 [Elaphomyces granulatus]|jgi:hypothetical protein